MLDTLAFLATFAALGLGSPVDLETRGKTRFSVDQVSSGRSEVDAPAIALLSHFNKYNSDAPAVVKRAAAAARQRGSVTATSYDGELQYVCPVTIGGKTFDLSFDTGSSDLWLYSDLQSRKQQGRHTIYNTKNAKRLDGLTWETGYDDGSRVSGLVYADKATVGGVTATNQAIQAASDVEGKFAEAVAADGILGLAFDELNAVRPQRQPTFFQNVMNSLERKLFTVDLRKGQPGSYDFGYIDTNKYHGEITYVPVITNTGRWQFSVSGYAVGQREVLDYNWVAGADTGTTLMVVPDDVVNTYYGEVPSAGYDQNQGGFTFPCSTNLPDFTVIIGGQKFVVPGSYITHVQISATHCFGGLQSQDKTGYSVFGDIFLKSQFVVHSMEQSRPQLGFAAKL